MILQPRARNEAERTFGYSAEFLSNYLGSQRTPIFHIPGYYASRGEGTACGRETWDNERGRPFGFWMSPKHAVKFAHPCKRCLKAVERAQS